jgi:hypothetical protein
MAAAIANYVVKEITGNISEELVDATSVASGDWYISKFTEILNVQCTGIGHLAFVASITGRLIVITCTGGDHVHLRVIGRP